MLEIKLPNLFSSQIWPPTSITIVKKCWNRNNLDINFIIISYRWFLLTSICFHLQATTRVKPFICTMPLRLEDGWNNIQLNLTDLTRRAYGTNYVETLRLQVHANCRLRRIYFSDRLYSEEELPPEFKLYLPMQVKTEFCNQLFVLLFWLTATYASLLNSRRYNLPKWNATELKLLLMFF